MPPYKDSPLGKMERTFGIVALIGITVYGIAVLIGCIAVS